MNLNCKQNTRILIAGAGYVGGQLAKDLHLQGLEVHTINRSKKTFPSEIHQHLGDLTQRETFQNLSGKFTHIFYLAGSDSRTEANYRKTYLDGPKALIDYINASSAGSRLIFSSSTSVYGQSNGEIVDENSPTLPKSFSGKIILEAESQILSQYQNSVIVRFSGIYGPGRDRLIRSALSLESHELVSAAYTNRIHQKDCANMLKHLMEFEQPRGIFLGSDSSPSPRDEVINWIRASKGLKPLQAEPKFPEKLNKRCSNSKILNSGFTFLYPDFRSGYNF